MGNETRETGPAPVVEAVPAPEPEGTTPAPARAATPAAGSRRHVLKQATVPILDEDGRLAALVGTAAFLIATIVAAALGVGRPRGEVDVPLWTCLVGLGIGLLFVAYCELRLWARAGHPRSGPGAHREPDE